jgi:two-component system, sensor histidine kinase and response regulator
MPALSGGHVLVAEDNEVNQFAAIHLLQKVGFSVDIARNGREAIDMSGRKDYTAVFMDCQMPEVDGYSATEAIRLREAGTKHTPIIAMTAHALDGDRDKCLAIGMDEYLAKPLRLQTIETLIGRLPEFRSAGRQSPDADTVFDSAQLSDIGDPDTEAALVSMFLDQASERLPQFKEAIDAGDDDRLHKLAHGLKGGAATVGAIRMAGLCGALCKLEAGENRPKAAEVHRQLADVLLDTAAAMHAYVERA